MLPWNENDKPLDPFKPFPIIPVDREGRPVNVEGTYYMLYYTFFLVMVWGTVKEEEKRFYRDF